ncbi:MAG: heparinase II/III-family protein, partial [Kiritimatiellae bacterium]|nr:heparinase II/III-family protein [Kiritimatiellia bacterium]
LIRARRMQGRVLTLILRWYQTGDEQFRSAAVAHVREMAGWRYWSWITWRKGDARPDAIFDLSYGENCATLAMAWDLLYNSLTDREKHLFVKLAESRGLRPFLKHTREGRAAFWFCRPDSNWNAVCAGGAGLLALAFWDELLPARETLRRVERSIACFFKYLDQTDGGWPEGIGYWNYGMYYGFMYLLSWERATGRQHPLLNSPSVRRTLDFPLDFCPEGVPCSFGDSNHWTPHPFHLAAAERLSREDILAELDRRFGESGVTREPGWPEAALLLLFHPRRIFQQGHLRRRVLRSYRGLDWAMMADRMPQPGLYMAMRGGTTEVPHGHRDLLSFHCVVNGEALITNINEKEYLDTTFGPRRFELFEMTPASKNTIFINGVGIASPSTVQSRVVRLSGAAGIRMVATAAMGVMRDGPVARFCARLFLMLDDGAFLILDRFDLTAFGRAESRMHTFADVKLTADGVLLNGKRAALCVSYACSVPARLWLARAAPTTPGEGARVLRWCTDGLHRSITMATLLVPGQPAAALGLDEVDGSVRVRVCFGGRRRQIRFTRRLCPMRE